ncbi:hypothetical protein BACCELL_03153 [Bacteroides cellulosilyticus DSM 14838]|uniref:Uncharacterized protein n=1 Tax=Bacteroides cellulosilyticus DSM 14838 TaxID=537012 RepID=E2NFT1_9BACE|nr:hypothetical protein BACCELL_03153 [Bacteroides cellulosilyticus DSM 14838]
MNNTTFITKNTLILFFASFLHSYKNYIYCIFIEALSQRKALFL